MPSVGSFLRWLNDDVTKEFVYHTGNLANDILVDNEVQQMKDTVWSAYMQRRVDLVQKKLDTSATRFAYIARRRPKRDFTRGL